MRHWRIFTAARECGRNIEKIAMTVEIISRAVENGTEPLLVRPRVAWRILGCGNTRGYELLAAGELESFLDGRARKITVASIRAYIDRQLAATHVACIAPPSAPQTGRTGGSGKIDSRKKLRRARAAGARAE
jgi:hypothetical protein